MDILKKPVIEFKKIWRQDSLPPLFYQIE